ncbi:FG-GAP and VCBS repeat-containing protein [Streptomyces xinghaiensis]|uniref:FG-GAP and VCBS repeat-containing protein n=1 Tax=Streptomyces xinghaiensis TaxID=1038928 RepID=UPI001EDEC4F7|nr:FG-GAP and VCBS repeat-containing protein [Streptomyces xinghaiensis]
MRRRIRPSLVARCAVVAALATVPSLLALPASAGESAPAARPAGLAPQPDFDGDGHADVASSAPGATIGGLAEAGYVVVVYSSSGGVETERRHVISQATAGVPGSPAAGGRFGHRTVARDLDGDGYTDLAVETPGTSSVTVLWGSRFGLDGGTVLPVSAGTSGDSLTGGDFNGDGHADLVGVSSVSEEWGDLRILYGPFTRGAAPAGTADVPTGRVFEPRDLVAGDITGDGRDDLVSLHDFEEMTEPAIFWRGTATGLARGSASPGRGASAVIGDVDGDGHGDLVMRTVPGGVNEDLPTDPGSVKVVYGTADGPGTRTAVIDQDTAGVPGASEAGDQFGAALAAGDVTGDGRADIAAGVPHEDLPAGADAGAVVLLKGAAGGLSGTGARAFHQDTAGVPGIAEAGDRFGAALALQDTDGDGLDDLAAGAPLEDGSFRDSGAVWVLRGAAASLTTTGIVSFGPSAFGAPEAGARLGQALPR